MADEMTENEVQTLADTPTLEELAERVAALENAAKYTLRYSGEQIDALLDIITERSFESGREKVTVVTKTPIQTIKLPVSFTVTDSTRILLSVQSPNFAYPFDNICVTLGKNSGNAYAMLTMGPNVPGSSFAAYLPTGDYFINWLVIGR
ncbi:MAG: hypothetical protein ACI4JW_08570 [Oscillospiraceae bacterium]